MGGEPWCFTPDTIARLTDWQIMELYVKPAAEKAEELERKQKGLPARPVESFLPPPPPGVEFVPTRKEYVTTATTFFGWSAEHANAEYSRQWPGEG